MENTILIDAGQAEEVRIAVVENGKITEFDFESTSKAALKGNIYLAKVMRVEPSLQAAFVDYGGNRHGFLPFSEIHPDYYQIPVADWKSLVDDSGNSVPNDEALDSDEIDVGEEIESLGSRSDDALDEAQANSLHWRRNLRNHYNIQEVIKHRQVMLVQVVKDERGNKGVSLTTYISLAGRYCVLMPNTDRGGGISRKITSLQDRNRLRKIAQSLSIPDGMGVIIRTAGAQRTKLEINRDLDHLLRLWEDIRTLTLNSIAPLLIYQEGSLIKRTVRDLYTKEIKGGIIVNGEDAYREAKSFMKLFMPSHTRHVKLHKDGHAFFRTYDVDRQLESLYLQKVVLDSGGYLIIHHTEALVAIDVNSGKSTREHSIENTAFTTNMEAVEEIARHLRLRDLAGLIVIDFIDMEEKDNNRKVERHLKEHLKRDRARIQLGRISHFGLLEMSRQRMRSSMLESTTRSCPHCQGAGVIPSLESVSLQIIRGIGDYIRTRSRREDIRIRGNSESVLHILNYKYHHIREFESEYGLRILFAIEDSFQNGNYRIEKIDSRSHSHSHIYGNESRDNSGSLSSRRNRGRRRGRGREERKKTISPPVEKDDDPDMIANSSTHASDIPSSSSVADSIEPEEKKPASKSSRGHRRKKTVSEEVSSPALNDGDGPADVAEASDMDKTGAKKEVSKKSRPSRGKTSSAQRTNSKRETKQETAVSEETRARSAKKPSTVKKRQSVVKKKETDLASIESSHSQNHLDTQIDGNSSDIANESLAHNESLPHNESLSIVVDSDGKETSLTAPKKTRRGWWRRSD